MKTTTAIVLMMTLFSITGCLEPKEKQSGLLTVLKEEKGISSLPFVRMSRDSLYNKVLGALVGSAVGDAMGAPTEMWSRDNIRLEYGFVDSLDRVVREPSPEGTWDYNLPAGGTTDDTRWKVFMSQYILKKSSSFYSVNGPDSYDFAQAIVDQYNAELTTMKDISGFEPAPYEDQMRRIAWLQEFALVARAYAKKDIDGYRMAVNKFYGGDLACPGLLYSPTIGIMYPGAPDLAYQASYRLSLFDIGYAMDITSLTAAMVAEAMTYHSSREKILEVLADIDPQQYFRSRLLGRITYRIYREALYIASEAKKVNNYQVADLPLTPDIRDTLYLAQLQKAYEMLDDRNQDVPFHAGELHLINLTALIFTDFNFRKALEFVINYGRDNDTVAAITGTILGAYHGFNGIPSDMKETVLQTNKEKLGIDLEEIAGQLTDKMIADQAVSGN
jgi:hypothetical protein